jgi:hypothetical protein
MSQIIFRTSDNREVLTGYDRPLNYCFLTVFDAEGEPDYSILDESDPFSWTSETVINKLGDLGIETPTGFEDMLREHEAKKLGNVIITY